MAASLNWCALAIALRIVLCWPGQPISPPIPGLVNFGIIGFIVFDTILIFFLGTCCACTTCCVLSRFLSLSSLSITTTPTQRRRQRRRRACARLAWHLHRTRTSPLTRYELHRVHQTLKLHHSRDAVFLRQIRDTMASTPWFCGWCRKTVKGSFTNCPWCGSHWQNSATGTPRRQTPYPPSTSPRRRQRHGHVNQRGYGSYGESEEVSEGPWNYHGQTKSPRRQPRKSPARPNIAKQKAKKNHGNRVPQAEPSWEPDHPRASANSSAPSTAAEQHLKEACLGRDSDGTALDCRCAKSTDQRAEVGSSRSSQPSNYRVQPPVFEQQGISWHRREKHVSRCMVRGQSSSPKLYRDGTQHIEDFETRDAEHQSSIQAAMEKYQNAKQEVETSKEALAASDITLDINSEVNDEELMADDTPSIQDDMKAMVTNLESHSCTTSRSSRRVGYQETSSGERGRAECENDWSQKPSAFWRGGRQT